MADSVENLVLEHLRHIRGCVDKLSDDMDDLKLRAGSLEEHVSLLHTDIAILHKQLDQHGKRLERIEQRLEIVDTA
jgi:chromosome segregation ATPase